jgi:RNA polymerase sigma-70 factor (ECF subfamily)
VTQPTVRSRAAGATNELQLALVDDAAFESWYHRTLPSVFSYLISRSGGDVALAEELTQQTFVAAVAQRSRYDGRSTTVTWLCGIARHKLADHFRALEREERRRMRLEVREIEMAAVTADEPMPDERLLIAEALRSLPAGQRAVLALVVLDDLPVAEAGRLLGKSHGATQSLLSRARENFRRAYGGGDGRE